jgi:murein DD-endopeptidase MepM/ murein hydrolase activator NlpD
MLHALEKTVGAASQKLATDAPVAPLVNAPVAEAGVKTWPTHDDSLAIPEGKVTSGFGWRRDPLTGATRFHQGIDIRAAYGEDVQTAAPGRVVSAGTEGGYGESVVIEHAGGIRTRYAHLSSMLVAAGDDVTAGQVIGRAGRSGRATGTHLHLEVMRADGNRVDPATFERFKASGVVADLAGGTSPGEESRTE